MGERDGERRTDPFCPRCDVVMDLHPSTEPWGCEVAEQKADLLNRFDSIFLPQHPPPRPALRRISDPPGVFACPLPDGLFLGVAARSEAMSAARKPFTMRQRRRWAQQFGNRPRNNWSSGDLPAPWCEGDVVCLVGEVPNHPDREMNDRLRGVSGPFCVVTYATSIGEGDEWYFRVEDGVYEGCSDRLHVIPGVCDYMAAFELVETVDPEGLALRERMLADGWSYTPPQTCEACGQRLPRRGAKP